MEREFGALKGLMGVNGLTGGDMMPDIGKSLGLIGIECNDVSFMGCKESCKDGCKEGCKDSCKTGQQNG